ncbi:MAG: hypothetical protein H0X45_08790 [Planctomycetes bacterium]|nr:hypothetical protein [Planctomycetota bacterium]
MSVRLTQTLFLIAGVIALVGCGGREESYSRDEAPAADAGEGVTLNLRSFNQESEEISITYEIANATSEEVSYPMDIYWHPTAEVNLEGKMPSSDTYITAEGRRLTLYSLTRSGKYDYVGKFSTLKSAGQGMGSGRATVGPGKTERVSLQFAARPHLEEGDCPFSLTISDIRKGGQVLKPLTVEIK